MSSKNRTPLTSDEVQQALTHLVGWSGNEYGLDKQLTFASFPAVIAFMQSCVDGIEQRQHHPVWTNKYTSLDIHLDTFDAGHRVTQKDIELATFLDSQLAGFGGRPDDGKNKKGRI